MSGVASVGPGVRRVESVRESFRSMSSRAFGRDSSRGAQQSTGRIGRRSQSCQVIYSLVLNYIPTAVGTGVRNTEKDIDFQRK